MRALPGSAKGRRPLTCSLALMGRKRAEDSDDDGGSPERAAAATCTVRRPSGEAQLSAAMVSCRSQGAAAYADAVAAASGARASAAEAVAAAPRWAAGGGDTPEGNQPKPRGARMSSSWPR